MNTRSSKTKVTFANPFSLSGFVGELPAGEYEVLVEEELIQGLSFEVWRRTATFLTVHGRGNHAGRTELRAISDSALKAALDRDAAVTGVNQDTDAAVPSQGGEQ